ncbi:unnamed protein product [Boreogadus saida]
MLRLSVQVRTETHNRRPEDQKQRPDRAHKERPVPLPPSLRIKSPRCAPPIPSPHCQTENRDAVFLYVLQVMQVINADAIVVKMNSGENKTVHLSSIRPPRIEGERVQLNRGCERTVWIHSVVVT